VEGAEEGVAGCGGEGFRREAAEFADGGAELVEVAFAAVAEGEVVDEACFGLGIEGVVEEGGDELDEFVAVHVLASFSSIR
jgi:hypothetical protein